MLMEITERQKEILGTIVKEYVSSAKPVSSELLEKKYKFGISPATIRNEMQALTKKEYLMQPHISAGRIPTDKGYRFWVDTFSEKETFEVPNSLKIKKELEEEKRDTFAFAKRLTELAADLTEGLVVVRLFESDFVFKEGWEDVMKEPEFKDKDCLLNFGEFLKDFENDIEDLKMDSGVKVFIGEENLFDKGDEFCAIVAPCQFPKKEQGIISIVGPKRMAYEKNINLINSLMKLLEEF